MKETNRGTQQPGPVDRRAFLRLSGLLGLGMASGGLYPMIAEAVRLDRKAYKVSETKLGMGTFVSMTLVHPSKDQAEEAMGLAFEEVERLTALMTRFDTSGAVACLNRDGSLRDLPAELTKVIRAALGYTRATGGYFDVTVKPVVDLFKSRASGGQFSQPTEAELNTALELVGSQHVEIHGHDVRFRKPAMGITLDGIAKGYIVDEASRVLSSRGIKDFLVNAGGDIKAVGRRADRSPWAVAIQDPQKKRQFPDVVSLTDAAIATSGDYEVYYDREKVFHHIVDPKTGLSPHLSRSVSVVSPTAMAADALATGVFVMGSTEGTRLINSLPECACCIVGRDGEIVRSERWRGAAT